MISLHDAIAARAQTLDPLKIYYVVLLPEAATEDYSPFKGFQIGWREVDWALGVLATLPADVLEGEVPLDLLVSQRMGGARSLQWTPLWITALEQLLVTDIGLFVVLFSGNAGIARRAEQWRSGQKIDVLHISTAELPGTIHPSQLAISIVISHCLSTIALHGSRLDVPISLSSISSAR